MSELVFYTNPHSRGRVVRWALEEIGHPYMTKVLAFGPEMKSEEYLAINPMGKVPALVHNGAIVTETIAICAYLADTFQEAHLAPALGTPARADYYRWLYLISGPLEAAMTDRALGVVVPEDKQGMVGYGSYEHLLVALRTLLKGKKYLAGDHFTIADLILSFYMEFDLLPKEPLFESYSAAHIARPAALRAKKIDDELVDKK